MSEHRAIAFEQSGSVTRMVLNRPEAANGMNDTMTAELADAAARCDTSANKAVVLTGSGRFFCAGGDLKAFANGAVTGPVQHRRGRRPGTRRRVRVVHNGLNQGRGPEPGSGGARTAVRRTTCRG